MWNVRMVSWVPGSPIDCAAMMPKRVAFLGQTVACQIAAVTLDADAAQSFAGQRGTDQHALDAALLDQFDHFRRELLAGAHDQAAVRKRGVADILRTEAAPECGPSAA